MTKPNVVVLLLITLSSNCFALNNPTITHDKQLIVDPQLTLPQLLEKTLQQYPDSALMPALQQESMALQKRGQSWLAQAPSISLSYLDDTVTSEKSEREFEGVLELPLWNWGQQDAGINVARQAKIANQYKKQTLRLHLSELLRVAVWGISIQKQRLETVTQNYAFAEQLLQKIKLQITLGNAPKIDLLVAKNELLEHKAELIALQTETILTYKRFNFLTQNIYIPADFSERKSIIKTINPNHPLLQESNAHIMRKRTELAWVKATGSGQAVFSIGVQNVRDETESINDLGRIALGLSIPFGGSAHLAPEIANAQLELSQAIVGHNHLYRALKSKLHKAKQELKLSEVKLSIAKQRKAIATEHFQAIKHGFTMGEINATDVLKAQAQTFSVVQQVDRYIIDVQYNIALYNQAVGVLP